MGLSLRTISLWFVNETNFFLASGGVCFEQPTKRVAGRFPFCSGYVAGCRSCAVSVRNSSKRNSTKNGEQCNVVRHFFEDIFRLVFSRHPTTSLCIMRNNRYRKKKVIQYLSLTSTTPLARSQVLLTFVQRIVGCRRYSRDVQHPAPLFTAPRALHLAALQQVRLYREVQGEQGQARAWTLARRGTFATHGVRWCPHQSCEKTWDRDVNAARNMRQVFLYMLRNGHRRPTAFQHEGAPSA